MRLHVLALAICVTGLPFTARTQETPDIQISRSVIAPPSPSLVDDGATSDYVIAGLGDTKGWQFSMGPTRQPDSTVLRLIRQVPGGAFGLECRRKDGNVQMRFLLDGYRGISGSVVDAKLIVGSGGGPLHLIVEDPPEGKQDSNLLVSDPVAITDILYAAAREVSGAEFRIEIGTRSFGTQLPTDKMVTEVSARICDGWRTAAQAPHTPE